MSTRWLQPWLCAAALLLTSGLAGAKPPDLPAEERVNCRETGPEQSPYDAGLVPAGAVELEAVDVIEDAVRPCEEAEAIDTFRPCLSEAVRVCWNGITHSVNVTLAGPATVCCAKKGDCCCAKKGEGSGSGCCCEDACKACKKACKACQKACAACAAACKSCQKTDSLAQKCAKCKDKCADCQKACAECKNECASCKKECAGCKKECASCKKGCASCQGKCPACKDKCSCGEKKCADCQAKCACPKGCADCQDKCAACKKSKKGCGKACDCCEESEPKAQDEQPAKPAQYTCPYLKKKAEDQQHEAEEQEVPPHTSLLPEGPLENLRRLEVAQKLLRRAERLCRDGHPEQAAPLYEKMQRLCPGSRYDRLAAERLHELNGGSKHEPRIETGEEEGATEPGECDHPQAKGRCVEEQVAELLEACQRAFTDGRYEQAEELARQAQELDPDCVAAHALVYRTHLLLQLREKRQAGCKDAGSPDCVILMPHMPPIDPRTVEALDSVLTDVEAVTGYYGIEVEEVGAKESEVPAGPEASQALLGRLVEVLQRGACVEVATGDVPGRLRVHCEAQVGGVLYRVATDRTGALRCVVLTLKPDAEEGTTSDD